MNGRHTLGSEVFATKKKLPSVFLLRIYWSFTFLLLSTLSTIRKFYWNGKADLLAAINIGEVFLLPIGKIFLFFLKDMKILIQYKTRNWKLYSPT